MNTTTVKDNICLFDFDNLEIVEKEKKVDKKRDSIIMQDYSTDEEENLDDFFKIKKKIKEKTKMKFEEIDRSNKKFNLYFKDISKKNVQLVSRKLF